MQRGMMLLLLATIGSLYFLFASNSPIVQAAPLAQATATPLPPSQLEIVLTGGEVVTVQRSVTYGELFVIGGLFILIVVQLFSAANQLINGSVGFKGP